MRSLWLIARLGRQRTAKGCRNLVRITGNQTTEVTIKKSNTIPATFVAVEKRTEGDTTIDRAKERQATSCVALLREITKEGKEKEVPAALACRSFFHSLALNSSKRQTAGLFFDWSPTFVSPRR